jgi:phosphohistidine phosphatase
MKTAIILRHAKSSWKQPELPDHDRPLSKRGKRDAPRVGEFLLEKGLTPDLIISSTAKRARKTAEAAAKASGFSGELRLTPALYLAAPEAYIATLRSLPDEYQRVMLVGHNPGLEELMAKLTGRTASMPTAAVAYVSFPITHWSELEMGAKAELIHLWTPGDL